MKTKKLLYASVAGTAVTMAGAANAADLRMPLKAPPPPAPVFSWSGCSAGGHWGWGWGNSNLGATPTHVYTTHAATAVGNGFGIGNNASGPTYGGQVGCDYQWPGSQFVIGVSGSWAGADINGQRDHTSRFTLGTGATATNASLTTSLHTKVDELASVTGRIGWAGTGIFGNNNALFYFKGGWAWAHERTDISGSLNFGVPTSTSMPFAPVTGTLPFAANFTSNRSGWTIGGGVEWALSFAPQASIFWEYDYYSFDHKDVILDGTGLGFVGAAANNFTERFNPKINVVKVGVNYRFFGGPGYGGP
jgi:outer membrane immunogenic protein